MLRLSSSDGATIVPESLMSRNVAVRAYEEMRRCMEELTGIKFSVSMGGFRRVQPEELLSEFSRNEVVATLYSRMDSDFNFILHKVIVMSIDSAELIGTILLSKAGIEVSEESIEDALREFANIVIGAYASVLSRSFRGRFEYSIPEVVVDYDTAIITELVLPLAESSKEVVTHNVRIRSSEGDVSMEVLAMIA